MPTVHYLPEDRVKREDEKLELRIGAVAQYDGKMIRVEKRRPDIAHCVNCIALEGPMCHSFMCQAMMRTDKTDVIMVNAE